jgi:glycosyltransferase involved in cell wall biosynthesis
MRVMQVMAGAANGGAETFFVNLVLALHRAGLDQRAIIRSNADRAELLRAGGVEPLELRFGRWTDLATVPALRSELARYRPDVVLTWMNRASSVFPVGDHLHIARLGGYYDLKYYRRCDHLFCNTPDIVEHVVAQGWPRGRAHYMPNYASIVEHTPVRRRDLDTPEDAVVLLSLGRLHEVKAIDVLLRAVAIDTRSYVWLAGDGPLRSELEAQTRSLGVADRVRFLGWREDRSALFEAADICVLPSRYEAFGTVTLEAWGHRRPLVAAASAGPGWIVRDGTDGLLVPVDDAAALAAAIARVIDERDLEQRLVDAGWRRYQAEFTEAACVDRYLKMFERLLAQHRMPHAANS